MLNAHHLHLRKLAQTHIRTHQLIRHQRRDFQGFGKSVPTALDIDMRAFYRNRDTLLTL